MESIKLREQPLFEIVLSDGGFEIDDASSNRKPKFYRYGLIENFRLTTRKVNWMVTLLSFIVSSLIGGSGDVYREKKVFKFDYDGQETVISLKNCDNQQTERTLRKINRKLTRKIYVDTV